MFANTARGQLEQGKCFVPCLSSCRRIWSREVGLAESSASSCSFSTLQLSLVLTHDIPPDFRGGIHLLIPSTAIESVPSLSGHALVYRWRSLPPYPLHTNSGCGERKAHINWFMVILEKATPVTGTTLRTVGSVPADSRPRTPSVRNCVMTR